MPDLKELKFLFFLFFRILKCVTKRERKDVRGNCTQEKTHAKLCVYVLKIINIKI